jgi:hypothetical protein
MYKMLLELLLAQTDGSVRLAFCRQFYRTYPIANALRSQFSWSQYRLLIQMDDSDKREYYEWETLHNAWTGRELERQINFGLYERLLLSNDKKSVLEVARPFRAFGVIMESFRMALPYAIADCPVGAVFVL